MYDNMARIIAYKLSRILRARVCAHDYIHQAGLHRPKHTTSSCTTISSYEQGLRQVLHRQGLHQRALSPPPIKTPAAAVIFDRRRLRQDPPPPLSSIAAAAYDKTHRRCRTVAAAA
jgi:hypothetical protein